MKNITNDFSNIFRPLKGLVIYNSQSEERDFFVESYDIDETGKMINAHPLALQESQELAEALMTSSEMNESYLQPTELLADNILYTRAGKNGYAIWYTKAQTADLCFVKELGLPDGKYSVPALLWRADKNDLSVFALADDKRPAYKTKLYYAPFFNVHNGGNVCMGTVEIDIEDDASLEDFIARWQTYFFTSRFSHLLGGKSPVKGNIVQLMQTMHNSKQKFPSAQLQKHTITLKKLIK